MFNQTFHFNTNKSDHQAQEDEEEISIHGDVAVYLYQVSAYENYVNSLKFKISFLNPRNGDKMLVYDHGYGKKYRQAFIPAIPEVQANLYQVSRFLGLGDL